MRGSLQSDGNSSNYLIGMPIRPYPANEVSSEITASQRCSFEICTIGLNRSQFKLSEIEFFYMSNTSSAIAKLPGSFSYLRSSKSMLKKRQNRRKESVTVSVTSFERNYK